MHSRRSLTTALALTAVIAAVAAPRLLPMAIADELPQVEPIPVEASIPEISELELIEQSPIELVDIPEVEVAPAIIEPEKPSNDAIAEVVDAKPIEMTVRPRQRRNVDLVIALDTSGSMDGLLDSVRARLWDIVGEVSDKEPDANLRVGLITFGSPGVAGAGEGYVKVRSPLTSDLDSLYGQVMSLTTDGGDEYVGWTVNTALTELDWSRSSNAARILFVAGNESADQARERYDFRSVAANAREKGIVINAIYAGDRDQGVRENWAAVAAAGGGKYTAINQQAGTYQVIAPQDAELQALNDKLNKTYIGYGARGATGKANQMRQDTNAGAVGGGSVSSRISAKAKAVYSNTAWDLVDGVTGGKLDLSSAQEDDLPEELRDMEATEREEYVDELAAERGRIQAEIDKVSKARKGFLKKKAKDAGKGGLDEAMSEALEEQL